MPSHDSRPDLQIAHVLFADIVGYSKLPMDYQHRQIELLQRLTSATPEFLRAQSRQQLISLPTGDGLALVFFGSAESPATCAVELTQALASYPELRLRIGLHTGPVYPLADINANRNVSGGGINIAQRVMDCGDAGHIIVSAALASVLREVSSWAPALHDLGEVAVKHGVRVHIFNLFRGGVGNPALPAAVSRERQLGRANSATKKIPSPYRIGFGIGVVTVLMLIVAVGFLIAKWNKRTIAGTRLNSYLAPRSLRVSSRPSVAMLGFQNLSGKPDAAWISPSLSQMIGTELSAGEKLMVVPSEQVDHCKIDLALSDLKSLGPETLSRVRDNMGSDFVVLGSFLEMGGQVRIDLSLQDAAKGETLVSISESGPSNKLPEMASRLGVRLREKLRISEPSGPDVVSARAAQSSSFAATRFYSEGLEKLHSFDTAGARDLFEQAIAEDPNYAMAHSALAEAWRSLGYGSKSAQEAKKALDLSSNLSRENRMVIEAQYSNSIHDNAKEAEIYKSLFTFYPDSLDYGLSLAKSQYYLGKWQDANATLDALQLLKPPDGDNPRIDHVRSAVALFSGDSQKALALAQRVELRATQTGARRLAAESLNIQCTLYGSLGDPANASAACDKAKNIYSQISDLAGEAKIWGQLASLAARRGDLSAGRSANERQIALLRKMEAGGGLGYAMTVAGGLSSDSGDYSKALKEYSEALASYQKAGEQQGVSSSFGNLGYVYALQGNLPEAIKNDEAAIAIKHQTNAKAELDLWLVNLANALLSKGDLQAAGKQLDEGFEVNQRTQSKRILSYLHACRSKLLLAEANLPESHREAELALKTAQDLHDEIGSRQSQLLLALLDIEAANPQSAADTARKSLAYFESAKDETNQIESRAVLIQALLASPLSSARAELTSLANHSAETSNVSVRWYGNIQIARARAALGDKKSAEDLFASVVSASKRSAFQPVCLEAELASAELAAASGNKSLARTQFQQIARQAYALGLKLLAGKARSSLGN